VFQLIDKRLNSNRENGNMKVNCCCGRLFGWFINWIKGKIQIVILAFKVIRIINTDNPKTWR
jgi:hypothetical protein